MRGLILVLCLLALDFSGVSTAQSVVDPGFGTEGEALFDSPTTGGVRASQALALCPRVEGGFWGLFQSHGDSTLSIAHFGADGQPDLAFGSQGRLALAVDLHAGLWPRARCSGDDRILFWRRRPADSGEHLVIEVQQVNRAGVLQAAARIDARDIVPGLTEIGLLRTSPVYSDGYYMVVAVRSTQFPDRRVLLMQFDQQQALLATRVVEVGGSGSDEAAKAVGRGPDGRVWLFGDVVDSRTGLRTWWANARHAQSLDYAAQRLGSLPSLTVYSAEWVRSDLIGAVAYDGTDGEHYLLTFLPHSPDRVQRVQLPRAQHFEGQPASMQFPSLGPIDTHRLMVTEQVHRQGDLTFGLAQRIYLVSLGARGGYGLEPMFGREGYADVVAGRCDDGQPVPMLPSDLLAAQQVGSQVLLSSSRSVACDGSSPLTSRLAATRRLRVPPARPDVAFRAGFEH